ncbi:ribosomal protein L4 [Massarina eburnea CBS 473.64]|uniref:Large ribosomal subunit protein uL4m n=1 Tax=Massarina eburnea CBS 473.64 TaxID=1395130 RepID=A0A6A6S7J0_9PLEO|nr:ribosomal protein L4 [Massarina eburnea CBS 473.64]
MASTRISQPMRGVTHQLSRLSIRQDALPKALSTPFARPITTSTSTQAAVATITTSADGYVPVKPLAEQTVLATIHQFPSLEPLRLERYPANHLYLPTRRDILHRAVVFEGDSTRLGTASTKTRYEVHGSARKIRPQKGSGRARLGDKKSPMLRGGGVSHGPKPRDFSSDLPKKVYDLAWRTALSYRFRKGELIIVDNAIEIESPSERLLSHIFELHDRERGRGRSLLVTGESRPLLEQALDKMDRRRQALTWQEVDVKDLLELSRIIIERSALKNILFSHQHDLKNDKTPPVVQSVAPYQLMSVEGWEQFRNLVLAPPAEREALRPDIYEEVAHSRLTSASKLPDSTEKARTLISVYKLAAEAKDLRRSQLPKPSPIELEYTELEARVNSTRDDVQRKHELVTLNELLVRWRDTIYQNVKLQAEAAENRRDACKYRGDTKGARKYEEAASGWRTDMSQHEMELFQAHGALHRAMAEVCLLEDDAQGAAEEQGIAQEMQDQVDRLEAELALDEDIPAVEEEAEPEPEPEAKLDEQAKNKI